MSETQEQWLPIVGYEGLYEVSNLGRVRSLSRNDYGSRVTTGRVLKLQQERSGHLICYLSRGNKVKHGRVHRLVLEAFVGPAPKGKPYALHYDDDPKNNRLDNLRWGSHRENTLDSVRNGGHYNAALTHCRKGHKFTEENTYLTSKGSRQCVECVNANARRRYQEDCQRVTGRSITFKEGV